MIILSGTRCRSRTARDMPAAALILWGSTLYYRRCPLFMRLPALQRRILQLYGDTLLDVPVANVTGGNKGRARWGHGDFFRVPGQETGNEENVEKQQENRGRL